MKNLSLLTLAFLMSSATYGVQIFDAKARCSFAGDEWYYACNNSKVNVLVQSLSNFNDPLLLNLTARNDLSYTLTCDVFPEEYQFTLNAAGSISYPKFRLDSSVSVSSITAPVKSFNESTYGFTVAIGQNANVNTLNCSPKVVGNVSYIDFGPLSETLRIMRSSIRDSLRIYEDLSSAELLGVSFANLEDMLEDIEFAIEDLEDDLADAGTSQARREISAEIDLFTELKTDIEGVLSIGKSCEDNSSALCQAKLAEINGTLKVKLKATESRLKNMAVELEKESIRLVKFQASKAQEVDSLVNRVKDSLKRIDDTLN